MNISAKELLSVLAHVERVREELPVTAVHVSRLIALLKSKGILSADDASQLDGQLIEHLDLVRDRLIVERDLNARSLPPSLKAEMVKMGVIVADEPDETVESDFDTLLERTIEEA